MEKEKIYRNKLDFYYISLVLYMLFLIFYCVIKGTFSGQSLTLVFHDPIIYIIVIFILFFLVVLISNIISAREIIIKENEIIFKNRFGQRVIKTEDILLIRFSRERTRRRVRASGTVRNVKMKLKNRKRYVRIRLLEYNNEKELANEFKRFSDKLTQMKNS